MRMRLIPAAVAVVLVSTGVDSLVAQKAAPAPPKKNPLLKLAEPWPEDDVVQARRVEAESRPHFKDTEPLAFTLTGDFSAVNKERTPNNKKVFPAAFTVQEAKGPAEVPVKIGSRGHFRLMVRNCDFVP